jgi:parallel beta-helix repeat protein
LTLAAIALVLVGMTPVLVAATSGATGSKRVALACGDTVTTSVTLTADITGCGGYGLNAGANRITINLNGHTISGSSATRDGLFDPSFTGVVFENGTITGFVRGVEIDGGSATVRNIRTSGNTDAGIYTFVPATITGNTVFANGNGGIIVGCCAADKSTVTNNIVDGNTGNGIVVSFTATGSTVSGNHALNNTNDGITMNTDGAVVSKNIANGNGNSGFVIGSASKSPPMKVSGNVANNNAALGISLDAGDTDGGGNQAHGNATAKQCDNLVCS